MGTVRDGGRITVLVLQDGRTFIDRDDARGGRPAFPPATQLRQASALYQCERAE